MQKRWVVILNKSPKGPLTETEVKTLIDQKFLRLNDLAFEVAPDNSQATTDWKLLWQFPEFNRRGLTTNDAAKKAPPTPSPEPTPAAAERRVEVPPEEQKRRALQALPEDLAAINPEDLVTRKRVQPMSLDEPLTETSLPGERRSFPMAPVLAVGGGLFLVVLWLTFGGSSTPQSRSTASGTTAPPTLERPLNAARPPNKPGAPPHFQKNPVVVRPPTTPQQPAAPAAREGNPFQLNPGDRGSQDTGRMDYGDPSVFDEDEEEDGKVLEEPAFKDKSRRRNRRGNASADEGNTDAPPTNDEEPSEEF